MSQPSADSLTGSGCWPRETCGSCCGSPSRSTLRPAEDAAASLGPVAGDPSGALRAGVADLDPGLAMRLPLALAHEPRVEAMVDDAVQEVLDDGVGLRDDRNAPVVLVDEVADDLRGGPGLAAPRRSLDGEVGAVEAQRSACDDRDGVPTRRKRRERASTHEAGRVAGEQVPRAVH